jgi:hypothetical protein
MASMHGAQPDALGLKCARELELVEGEDLEPFGPSHADGHYCAGITLLALISL